jgi:DNA-binding MarR family transcriptional regulator
MRRSAKVSEASEEGGRDQPAEPAGSSERNGDVKFGVLDQYIGFHLRLAQDASFRAFAKHAGQRNLKPGRFAAMHLISENPGISQIALSRAIARDKSTVTPLIQDLQRRGLVVRHLAKNDRRSFTLTLTRAGEEMLAELQTPATEHDHKLDEIVGPRKAEFIRLLKKIADQLA